MNISVASIMHRVDGYRSLNIQGICESIIVLVGQMGNSLNFKKQRFIHVEHIRLTLA